MATWVLPALAPLAGDVCFDLYREDQEHTSALLRAGTVMAAVTVGRRAGARLHVDPPGRHALPADGHARLRAALVPRRARPRRRSPGPRSSSSTARTTCSTATCTSRPGDVPPPAHYVPASADYVAAVALGLGWGMVPDLQARDGAGELVALDPAGAIDVVLYWQQWRLRSTSLDRVREAVLAAAGRELDQPD